MFRVFGQDDYSSINEAVQAITKEKQNYERIRVPKTVAVEMLKVKKKKNKKKKKTSNNLQNQFSFSFFQYNQFKSQILRDKVPEGSYCTVYRCGTLMDPCRGPHLPSTARVTAFAVTKNSSAYWQSKAENPQVQEKKKTLTNKKFLLLFLCFIYLAPTCLWNFIPRQEVVEGMGRIPKGSCRT